jgi:hypothetical protein
MTTTPSAIRVRARLDGEPNRGLWLVKWLLLIPHFIVLSLLWIAFTVLTVIAFFAVLINARYPRAIFDFNVGVLRWTWRVWFYGYGALGTDRYPPFSLGPEPDYPATLDIPYPETLSRGLVLVKWWLLAIPHYLVVAFFVGSGFVLWRFGGGLVSVLALIAAVALLFTGRYPRGIFDFVMGMNRWVFRVAAYASLMTDEYPPFRMDNGGEDGEPLEQPAPPTPAPAASGWTAGRVIGVVVATLLLLGGLGAGAGGGTLLWADTTQRDSAGYLSTTPVTFTDNGYALRFDVDTVVRQDAGWLVGTDWLGDVRVRVSRAETSPVFLGIARTEDVNRYLTGVPHGRFDGQRPGMLGTMRRPGMFGTMRTVAARPPTAPAEQDFWVVSSSGAGPRSLTWDPRPGSWSLVVMNTDAEPGLRADVDFGATVPALRPVSIAVLGAGAALLIGGSVLLALMVRPRNRRT